MFKNESAYGTRVVPDHTIKTTAQLVDPNKVRAQSTGLQSGAIGPLGDHYVDTNEDGNSTFEFECESKGIGLLLQALMGTTVTPALLTGSAYSQTHTFADPVGKSLTLQQGVPIRAGGTGKCEELNGARCTSMEFTIGAGGFLHASSVWDGHQYDETQTLATPSYSLSRPFTFRDGTLKTGVFNSEVALTGSVRSMSVKIERLLDTADFTLGSQFKQEPVLNGLGMITGTITSDFTAASKAAIQDLSLSNTPTSLVYDFVGAAATGWSVISGTTYPEFKIVVPSAYFDASTANPNGPAEITASYNWTWRYDGTNMPFIYVVSSDATL